MKKQHSLFSSLILLFVLTAFGCSNDRSSDQTSSAAQDSADAGVEKTVSKTGEKSRINNSVDWATYRGDNEGSAYSSLDQITAENVQQLEEAWHYDTRELVGPGMSSNPIIDAGVMYFADSELNLVALDEIGRASVGKECW